MVAGASSAAVAATGSAAVAALAGSSAVAETTGSSAVAETDRVDGGSDSDSSYTTSTTRAETDEDSSEDSSPLFHDPSRIFASSADALDKKIAFLKLQCQIKKEEDELVEAKRLEERKRLEESKRLEEKEKELECMRVEMIETYYAEKDQARMLEMSKKAFLALRRAEVHHGDGDQTAPVAPMEPPVMRHGDGDQTAPVAPVMRLPTPPPGRPAMIPPQHPCPLSLRAPSAPLVRPEPAPRGRNHTKKEPKENAERSGRRKAPQVEEAAGSKQEQEAAGSSKDHNVVAMVNGERVREEQEGSVSSLPSGGSPRPKSAASSVRDRCTRSRNPRSLCRRSLYRRSRRGSRESTRASRSRSRKRLLLHRLRTAQAEAEAERSYTESQRQRRSRSRRQRRSRSRSRNSTKPITRSRKGSKEQHPWDSKGLSLVGPRDVGRAWRDHSRSRSQGRHGGASAGRRRKKDYEDCEDWCHDRVAEWWPKEGSVVAEGRQDAVDDRTVTTFAYVRVEECANIAAILSYLRKDPPKVLMMFCEKSESAKVWGGQLPARRNAPISGGGHGARNL